MKVEGHVDSDKRINLLFDEVTQHYHVIANLTGVMAKRYVVKAVTKAVNMAWYILANRHVVTMLSTPCISAGPRIPYDICNRHFRSQVCFDNNKQRKVKIRRERM